MILYHGSNTEVIKPKLIPSKRLLDFGPGFYLTSDYEQASRWAVRTYKNRENGMPIISSYQIDEKEMFSLDTILFDSPNKEWLRFVAENRMGKSKFNYDVVIGPVANDQAVRTINNYLKGYFDEEIAIQLLLPQKLKDQYAFKTEAAVSLLLFKEANVYDEIRT